MWGDELRVGLRGRVCRVWAPRGTAVPQEVRTGWKYTCVAVAINSRTGRLWWAWQENMKGEEMARIWGAWAEDPALQARQEALAEVLNAWQADPERVRRLCGWDWIRKALKDLPAANAMP